MDYVSGKGTAEHTKIYACATRIMRQCSFVWLFLWAGSRVGWPTSGCSLLLDPVGFRMDFETIQPKNRRRVCVVVKHTPIYSSPPFITFPPYFHSLSVPLLSLLSYPLPFPSPSPLYPLSSSIHEIFCWFQTVNQPTPLTLVQTDCLAWMGGALGVPWTACGEIPSQSRHHQCGDGGRTWVCRRHST